MSLEPVNAMVKRGMDNTAGVAVPLKPAEHIHHSGGFDIRLLAFRFKL